MDFGLFMEFPVADGASDQEGFDQGFRLVDEAESMGVDSVWLAEYHFIPFSVLSSPMTVGTAIAARTEKIRIGTAVLVPTLHNPVRLAEDTAMLDTISGGRLDVGYGRGAASYEYAAYTVDQSTSQQRFQEAIRMVDGLWTTPEYTHHANCLGAGGNGPAQHQRRRA